MLKRVILSTMLLLVFQQVKASPYINADDRYLHSSIQILQKSGHLNLPMASYPLSWVSVLQQVAQIDRTALTDNETLALQRILVAADFARQEHIRTLIVSGSSEPVNSGLQGARFDESALIGVMSEHKGHNWAVGIRTNFRIDARDDKEQHFDGSYLAYTLDNWVISLAQQPLWLGNMHSQSEQLNWQGRAPKTVQISRLNPGKALFSGKPTKHPLAARLIVGEMPSSVSLNDARFVLATVNLIPLPQLELGVTAAQLRDVENTLLTKADTDSEHIEELQLDARYALGNSSIYGQWGSQQHRDDKAQHFGIGSDYHQWLNGWQSTFFTEYKYYEQNFLNWRQPESFQKTPFIQALAVKSNLTAGAYFFRADGVGASIKVNQIRYNQSGNNSSHQLYYVSGQHPLFNGLVTAEITHSTKTAEGLYSRWQGAVRYEYRW